MMYLDIAIIAGELAGLVFSIDKHGWRGQFVYYTQCSNYLLLAAAAVHLACLLRRSVPAAAKCFLVCEPCRGSLWNRCGVKAAVWKKTAGVNKQQKLWIRLMVNGS